MGGIRRGWQHGDISGGDNFESKEKEKRCGDLVTEQKKNLSRLIVSLTRIDSEIVVSFIWA